MAQGRDSQNDISIGREATEAPREAPPADCRSQRRLRSQMCAWRLGLASEPTCLGDGDTAHGHRWTCRWKAAAAAWPADLTFVGNVCGWGGASAVDCGGGGSGEGGGRQAAAAGGLAGRRAQRLHEHGKRSHSSEKHAPLKGAERKQSTVGRNFFVPSHPLSLNLARHTAGLGVGAPFHC